MASRAAEVKSAIRALFRARRRSFAGDVPMLSASASQIRSEFEANKNVTDPEKLDQLLLQARETAEFLVLNVVQAKLNDRGNYEIKLEESHVGNSIEEIGAKAPCSKNCIGDPSSIQTVEDVGSAVAQPLAAVYLLKSVQFAERRGNLGEIMNAVMWYVSAALMNCCASSSEEGS